MAADALSDILRRVRMTGAVFFRVAGKEPWVAEQFSRETVLPMIRADAEHLMAYHIVTEGRCFATIIGGPSVELKAGQVIVFTRGDQHVMSSGPGMRADVVPVELAATIAQSPLPFAATYGNEGEASVKLVCGFLACDARPFNPLLENLPPILIADSSEGGGMPWLAELIRIAIGEASDRRVGGESVLGRLTELMFIEVVRRHLEQSAPDERNWLAGLRDTFTARALSLIHATPSREWTVAELAKLVGLSRSEFSERFSRHVGLPPMQYVAKWRMQVASGLLRDGLNIASVAAEVGYGSEAAFSRAFKKIVGASPSAHRQGLS